MKVSFFIDKVNFLRRCKYRLRVSPTRVVRSKELTESGDKIDGDKKYPRGNSEPMAFKS